MRIGILTLHDSPNYGAVLQAFAMRSHLTRLGHSAFVIDRRRDPSGAALRTPPLVPETVRPLGLFSVDAVNGAHEYARRCERTLAFERDGLGLSDYHFHSWKSAPRDLGLDVILVGSDQVWNANNLDPNDYLLKDVPGSPPGIAYAASIGMTSFPPERLEDYRTGFARFQALGVREAESVGLVRALGFAAEHVVDPVLLAGTEVWKGLVDPSAADGGRTFAYFLAENVPSLLPELAAFAAATGRRVDLFVDWYVRRAARGLGSYLKNRRFWRRWREKGIDFRLDAGPAEFVRAIASAEAVVSNSYHALVFSLVFGRQVRIVLPTHPVRRQMNARLREFEGTLTEGPLIVDDLHTALQSLSAGERVTVRHDELDRRVNASRAWLDAALRALSSSPA